jgi:hypothetical protein
MKKLTTVLFFLLSFNTLLKAQDIESWINAKKPFLFEKLYLHVDRELYAPGDIIWLKVYQVNGTTHQLNTNFRNVFVQLISEEGKVVKDLMLLSVGGQANGEFQTQLLANGMYTIRATTKYLENFGEEACFHQKIWISNSFNSASLEKKDQHNNSSIDVSFLPEGGNLISNAVNIVAFKAIDSKGKGIFVRGKIMNESGDTITSFVTTYLGMGKLNLMPEEGVNYYATIEKFPELKIPLPKATGKALCLTYKMGEESLMFDISASMNVDKFPEFYFVASHKGTVLFQKKVAMVDYTQAIKVSKKLFPQGISKITLLDITLNPIVERLIFVDFEKEDLLSLHVSQKVFKPREEVKIDVDALLDPGDSIKSTLSATVVNKNYLSTGENNQNIKSYLLLDSDLKGAIEFPATYFVNDQFHNSAEKLDLLMLVHGWRSYLWDDVEQTPTPITDDWNDAGINISGYVKKLLWNAPSPETEVSMDYVFRYNKIGKAITDQNGRFLIKHAYFIDTLKVMINARTKKGKPNCEIILDSFPKSDSLISSELLNKTCFNSIMNSDFNNDNLFRQQKELEFSPEKGSILLEGVDIAEKKTFSFTRSFGAYDWADRTLTVTKDDYRFPNVIDFLVYNIGGVIDREDSVIYGLHTINFMIDGMDHDLKEIKTIHIRDIETVDKYADPVSGSVTVAIYLKPTYLVQHYDAPDIKGRIISNIKGFNRPAIFYSPKYTLENINSPKPDYRPTLYWNPDVSFVNGKTNLDFFTSDESTDYVVYLEGITKEGKICYGTTSFKVVKK